MRHFCGWYFYVHVGFSDELTAYQLGHADAKLVRDLYGYGKAGALERRGVALIGRTSTRAPRRDVHPSHCSTRLPPVGRPASKLPGRMPPEHVDVLIVGAGLSGVGAGCHLRRNCPDKTFALLEARDSIGGTWDLFRYPGIRSDSDMYTLGYNFKPWAEAKAIADGPSIREYVRETAEEYGVDKRIRTGHRVVRAEWSSEDARWTVEAERTDSGETVQMTCDFLMVCSGYYSYDDPYMPEFKGTERFQGRIVHPQLWTDDVDYAGKRVVVIGSGATAVTLVPAMAEKAEHVTMLQRSPSYIVTLPAEDGIANFLRRVLPAKLAYSIVRWKNVLITMAVFQLSRRRPKLVKALVRRACRHLPPGYDVDTHFKPSTTRGTSGCAWSRTATCSRRSPAAGPRSSPTRSRPSPRRGYGWARARISRPT